MTSIGKLNEVEYKRTRKKSMESFIVGLGTVQVLKTN